MKKPQKWIALALLGILSACSMEPSAPAGSGSGGGEQSSQAQADASEETPSSEEAPSSESNPSSEDSPKTPNCYALLSDLTALKGAEEVILVAKNGSSYVGYTGKEIGNTPWYHEAKDLGAYSSGELKLSEGLASLKLSFSSEDEATIQSSYGYLWSGYAQGSDGKSHANIGHQTSPCAFTFIPLGGGAFQVKSPESTYLEYYNGHFCAATEKHKAAASVYFYAPSYKEIPSSEEDSQGPSTSESLPDVDPSSYWESIDVSLTGNALRKSLQTAIKSYKTSSTSYNECLDVGAAAASYPLGSSKFVPFYHSAPNSGFGGSTTVSQGSCNKEHTWPNSRGCGKRTGPAADPFIIRPTLKEENTARSNKFYGVDSGTWDPASCGFEGSRGESARVILYAATAYYGTCGSGGSSNGNKPLELVDKTTDAQDNHTMGRLSTLLKWNREYQPNDMEKQINDYLYDHGYGRNPFVDNPEFADRIWTNSGIRA